MEKNVLIEKKEIMCNCDNFFTVSIDKIIEYNKLQKIDQMREKKRVEAVNEGIHFQQ